MVSQAVYRASEVTGALRYWTREDVETIVSVSRAGWPSEAPDESEEHVALAKVYWRRVRVQGPDFFAWMLGKKHRSVPETREGIVAKARAEGVQPISAILGRAFYGEETGHGPEPTKILADVLVELGPIAVGLGVSALTHGGFSSQESFAVLGGVFLERAKLLTALVVSLAGADTLQGERVALASVSHLLDAYEKNVRELLQSVADLPGYDVAVRAAVAKLDEYSGELSKKRADIIGNFVMRPREYKKDIVCQEYDVPVDVDYW